MYLTITTFILILSPSSWQLNVSCVISYLSLLQMDVIVTAGVKTSRLIHFWGLPSSWFSCCYANMVDRGSSRHPPASGPAGGCHSLERFHSGFHIWMLLCKIATTLSLSWRRSLLVSPESVLCFRSTETVISRSCLALNQVFLWDFSVWYN